METPREKLKGGGCGEGCRGTAFTTSGISLIELIYRGSSGSVVKDLAQELEGHQKVGSSSPSPGKKCGVSKNVYNNDK